MSWSIDLDHTSGLNPVTATDYVVAAHEQASFDVRVVSYHNLGSILTRFLHSLDILNEWAQLRSSLDLLCGWLIIDRDIVLMPGQWSHFGQQMLVWTPTCVNRLSTSRSYTLGWCWKLCTSHLRYFSERGYCLIHISTEVKFTCIRHLLWGILLVHSLLDDWVELSSIIVWDVNTLGFDFRSVSS